MRAKKKKETIELLEIMIQEADKGPSGFWTDDYEGCGNPNIFPEFAEGLKCGKLVQTYDGVIDFDSRDIKIS